MSVPTLDGLLDLAALALALGRVNRATFHEDGSTPESDTDHTVMLAIIAPALAALYPNMNVDLVCAYAVVHDLGESITGDVNTLAISASDAAAKKRSDRAALHTLCERFAGVPWLVGRLREYEAQEIPEARLVRLVDKILPKLTHILNGGAALHGKSVDALARAHDVQLEDLRQQYPEFRDTIQQCLVQAMHAAEQNLGCTSVQAMHAAEQRLGRAL